MKVLPWLLLGCAAVLARADDPVPEPTPTPVPAFMQTRNGKVYHDPKLVALEADSVVFNTREGLVKVPKANLTDATLAALHITRDPASADMVMDTPNLQAPSATPTPPTSKPTPKPRTTPLPKPPPNPVYKGCTITSFAPKVFGTVQGCAEVVIQNDTESPVVVYPHDFAAVTPSGSLVRGHKLIMESYPPIIRRSDTVSPKGTLTEIVTFIDGPLEIASVRWAH
jgi:hypothetical protein